MAAESNTERRVLVTSMRQALWAQPALLVRGSSRRITIMRFRPANIRVINRRDSRSATADAAYADMWKHELRRPGRLRGPAIEGGLLAGLDERCGSDEEIEQNKLT